ncbi:tetratricopeptide repeat protein [Streptomyces sp. LARHCF249]
MILTGTGGVGKTQLAASLARNAWEASSIDVLVWITAGTRAAVISAYAQAAAELLGISPADPELAASAFLSWLEPKSGTQPCRWLIVLDGLADPSDVRGLWPPSSPQGATWVTTQRRDAALAGQGRQFVDIGLFTCDEAISYLTEFLAVHGHVEHHEQLASLATDLGYLPLALSQAAAYVVDAAINLADYRSLLKDRATELRDVLPDPSTLPDDQNSTVAAAWSLSIERADLLRPVGLARPMLQLASALDGNGIPISVLTSERSLGYLANNRAVTSSSRQTLAEVSPNDALAAVRSLHRLNLIDHNPTDSCQTVHTHQLIQRAVRETLPPDARLMLTSAASDSLATSWTKVDRNTRMDQALRANAETLQRIAGEDLFKPHPHIILFRLGRSLGEAGQASLAMAHFRDVTITSERINGTSHPLALAARGNFAAWLGEAGDHTNAVTELEFVRSQQDHLLGAHHPHTLTSRLNLAIFRGRSGDFSGAVKELVSLLPDQTRLWGGNHREVLFARHELARWTGKTGDITAAIDNLESLAIDQEQALGPADPDTLFTKHELACWQGQGGQPILAAKSLAALTIAFNDSLGADHPRTLTVRGDLARWRAKAGNPAGAVRDLRRLLNDRERILGLDHPSTLTTRNDLASWIGGAGNPTEAAREFTALIPSLERILGPEHITTLTARDNQITWRARSGDAIGAAAESNKLLLDMAGFLGEEHPTTLTARHNHASRLGESGDIEGALANFRNLLVDFERILGPHHPSTKSCRNGFAYWESRVGNSGTYRR